MGAGEVWVALQGGDVDGENGGTDGWMRWGRTTGTGSCCKPLGS